MPKRGGNQVTLVEQKHSPKVKRVTALLKEAGKKYSAGLYKEVCEMLELEDTCTLAALDDAQRLILLGKARREQGEFELARDTLELAVLRCNEEDLAEQRANALNSLASIHAISGDIPEALRALEQAIRLYKRLGSARKQADVLSNVGNLKNSLADYEGALLSLKDAYDLIKKNAPGTRSAVINLQNLGNTYHALGNLEKAETLHRDAGELAGKLSDRRLQVVSLINMAEAQNAKGKLGAAEMAYSQARSMSVEHGLKVYEVNALEGLGNVCYHKGFYEKAKTFHQRAVALAEAIDDRSSVLSVLLALARDELATRHAPEAVVTATKALVIAEQSDKLRSLYEAHELLADGYKQQGMFERALFHTESFHRLERQVFNEQSQDKTRHLAIKFEVEKASYEADMYRLRSEMASQAYQQAERLVRERTKDLEAAQLEIVTRLAVAAEYRDDDTGEHTRRVGRSAALMAHLLGWSRERVQLMYTAARLHDVGKIGIPDNILFKPGKLSDEEFQLMRSHARIGGRILADGHSPLLELAEEIALNHHERWDGRGYPDGLAGEMIPESARIVSVADVLDALIHERPYKKAWTVDDALAEMNHNSGSQFDARVMTVCLKLFAEGTFSPLDIAENWTELELELATLKVDA